MADLRAQIEESVSLLARILAQVTVASSGKALLPLDCYDLWRRRAELHGPLRATAELLPMRDHAWAVLNSIMDDRNIVDWTASMVRFCGQEMPFAVARHLALAAYLTTNWSLYDRLANVCGRLVGHENIGNNPLPMANPKLLEHFVVENKDKYKQHGFSLGCVIRPAYGWPAKLSYVVRNWLVHEGLEADGIPLFCSNDVADSFLISNAAMKRIEDLCAEDNISHAQCCLSSDTNHPWYDKSILTILRTCHAELDEMFASLLNWGVGALVGQVDAFSQRDRSTLLWAAVIGTTTTT